MRGRSKEKKPNSIKHREPQRRQNTFQHKKNTTYTPTPTTDKNVFSFSTETGVIFWDPVVEKYIQIIERNGQRPKKCGARRCIGALILVALTLCVPSFDVGPTLLYPHSYSSRVLICIILVRYLYSIGVFFYRRALFGNISHVVNALFHTA